MVEFPLCQILKTIVNTWLIHTFICSSLAIYSNHYDFPTTTFHFYRCNFIYFIHLRRKVSNIMYKL